MAIPTVLDAETYMGIDYADAAVHMNVARALNAAIWTIRGAVGEDVDTLLPNDPRTEQLILAYTDDLYSDHGVSAKVSGATRRSLESMEIQLRQELTRARMGEVDSE